MIIWVLAEDCIPSHSLGLQSKHDREKVEYLAQEDQTSGKQKTI